MGEVGEVGAEGDREGAQPSVRVEPKRRLIERPRLTRLLDAAPSHVLALVAPAGYGKTTLAREWTGAGARRAVWYRATEASSDLAALISGLARAVEPEIPGLRDEVFEHLSTNSRADVRVEHLAGVLLRHFQCWPTNLWLVIDDHQFLAASDPCEQFVALLSEFEPLNLLIASRERPSWVTPRRLLYGEIYELNRAALALTLEEAALVTGSQTRSDLPGLLALTEGWPAVIGLAALAGELPAEGDAPLQESLYDYFAEELFAALEPEGQKALCELSLLPVLRRSTAGQVLGHYGKHVLEQAERVGFLTCDPGDRYELHPLLRAFLREKLAADPSSVKKALDKVVPLLLDAEQWDDAFSLIEEYELAEDFSALIGRGLYPLLEKGRIATIDRWITAAYEMQVRAPETDLMQAEVLFRGGNWDESERLACRAAEMLPKQSALTARALSRAGQSAHLANRQSAALKHYQAARDAAENAEQLSEALWGIFVAKEELEQMDDAVKTLEAFERVGTLRDEDELRLIGSRLSLACRRGDLGSAVKLARSVDHLTSRRCNPIAKCSFLSVFASALCLVARYRESLEVGTSLLETARTYDVGFALPYAYCLCASAHLGLKNMRNCDVLLETAEHAISGHDDAHIKATIQVTRARRLLAQRKTGDAVKSLPEPRWDREPSRGMKAEYLATRALALACAGEARFAEELALRATETSLQVDARVLAAGARAIASIVDSRDPTKAAKAVWIAVDSTGNLDSLISAYRAFPPLLGALNAVSESRTRLEDVVHAGRDLRLAQTVGVLVNEEQQQSSLTPREQEVLELLHKGMTNRQIARTLWISETTAKVHVRHIFRKLNVHSRAQAAVAAGDAYAERAIATDSRSGSDS